MDIRRLIKDEAGIALIITLLILVLLVTIIMEFDFSTRREMRSTGNFRDEIKAYYLAKSGINAARAALKDDKQNSNRYDALTELWASPIPPIPLGDGFVFAEIIDEGRKINLNSLITGNDKADDFTKKQIRRLFELLEIDPNLVDPIIDWIDKNDETEPNGAESGYYNGLDRPYNSKNGPMETISELRLIRGINADIYNKVSRYLTIYPYPIKEKDRINALPNVINMNTADPIIIKSLDPGIDDGEVERITQNRPYTDLARMKDTIKGFVASVVYNRLIGPPNHIDIRSDIFQISAEGDVNGVKKRIYSVVERRSAKDVAIIYWRVE